MTYKAAGVHSASTVLLVDFYCTAYSKLSLTLVNALRTTLLHTVSKLVTKPNGNPFFQKPSFPPSNKLSLSRQVQVNYIISDRFGVLSVQCGFPLHW